jgi:hypothetical protein
MAPDPNRFSDAFLGFSITKPSLWRFMPPAWSPAAMLTNSAEPDSIWRLHAPTPFVCFMGSHASATEAFPTVQVTARRSRVPTSAEADALQQQTIAFLGEQFPDFDVLESSTSNIVAGFRASRLRSRYSLVAGEDDELLFSVLARSIVIFSPGVSFTIGMSSSEDPAYFDEDAFDRVLASVSIAKRV